ncbi:MAG TPA: hypothetical protein VLT59_14335, partial [Steroidobacteraceae bacterium]|nr:hypothetical protein [Steroidobacteraceae bacterium]
MRHIASLVLGSLIVVGGPLDAATPLSADETNVVHFAFATQLGSGVYVISGRTVQIYRFPFAVQLREPGADRVGVRLTLPVTIGFIGFKPIDVVDTGLPENLDTISFVPGVEFDMPVTERWRILPFAEAGIARDRTSEFDQRVFAVGVRSNLALGGSAADWTLFNELVHVGVDLERDGTDDFNRFRTGLTARRPLGGPIGRHQPDVLGYLLHEWYLDTPAGFVNGEGGDGSATQFEFGMTFGTAEGMRIGR